MLYENSTYDYIYNIQKSRYGYIIGVWFILYNDILGMKFKSQIQLT
jgi:hypothetical protein